MNMTGSTHTLHTRKARVLFWSVAASLVLLVVAGGIALALPSQRPPHDDVVRLGSGTTFTLSAKMVGAPLRIGNSSTLLVTVKNPSASAMRVTSLNARAVSIFNQKCKGAWIQVRRYTASAALGAYVPPRTTRTVRLTIRLANIPGVNQDACKNVNLPIVLSGQAVVIP